MQIAAVGEAQVLVDGAPRETTRAGDARRTARGAVARKTQDSNCYGKGVIVVMLVLCFLRCRKLESIKMYFMIE